MEEGFWELEMGKLPIKWLRRNVSKGDDVKVIYFHL